MTTRGVRYRVSVSQPAISLQVLPAGYGDCLLVSCPVGDRAWRMLVDTGPDECWPQLRERLATIPQSADGKRHIDLAVISHIDHDHIGGAALLFSDKTLGLSFGDVWFNAPPRPATRGVAEGQSLSELLGAPGAQLPWNRAFGGRAVVTAADGSFVQVQTREGDPRITLLSPTPKQLTSLFKVWDKELDRLRRKEHDKAAAAPSATRGQASLDPKTLAAKITSVDRAAANGSSIAFLLEHGNASLLLAADAFSTVLVPALGALARQRRQPLGLKVDAIKLSHHGSRANVTVDLLKAVQAGHYIVSTNGAIFNHPDDEGISRVVIHGGRQPKLWFNYDNERSRRWADPKLRSVHGYDVVLPASPAAGLQLELGVHDQQPTSGRRGTR
jgi:beta-lactamase superfamily II metal-dependent hydrolase